jgi:adenosylhomocysteinase
MADFPAVAEMRLLVITHCLVDRPDFLRELASGYSIARVLPIEYSASPGVVADLTREHKVELLPLSQLMDQDVLFALTCRVVEEEVPPLAIVEIGGYHAPLVGRLRQRYGERFVGCVESTERGHREYAAEERLAVPVVSVARSPLKEIESQLIGPSVAFSVEAGVRSLNLPLAGLTVGVLGYGRVGRSLAYSLAGRSARVWVHDQDPRKRASAVAEGFASPNRQLLIQRADVIVGATGNTSLTATDFPLLKDNVVLASASSKRIEFATGELFGAAVHVDDLGQNVDRITLADGRAVFLLSRGEPANFAHGAVVGPVLSLVHAEIIAALWTLYRRRDRPGLHRVDDETQDRLCARWVERFLD